MTEAHRTKDHMFSPLNSGTYCVVCHLDEAAHRTSNQMLQRLRDNAAMGCDLSPGDPVAAWALAEIERLRAALAYTEEWRNYYRSMWLHTDGREERPGSLPRPTRDAPSGICLCYETPCRCLRDRRPADETDGCRYPMSYGAKCTIYPNCPCGIPDKTSSETSAQSSNTAVSEGVPVTSEVTSGRGPHTAGSSPASRANETSAAPFFMPPAALDNVANWLENGCEVKHAISELRILAAQMRRPASKTSVPTTALCSKHGGSTWFSITGENVKKVCPMCSVPEWRGV